MIRIRSIGTLRLESLERAGFAAKVGAGEGFFHTFCSHPLGAAPQDLARMGKEMKHEDIWRGIDRLAEARGLSVSGMARRAGLDPTTFNRSKRVAADGKRRWPTTESLAKILQATDATLGDFVALMHDGANAVTYTIPAAEASDAADPDMFDEDGFPMGPSWGKIDYPAVNDADVFGLFVEGDAFDPVYRDGDLLIVSPHASVRRGDRVLAKQRGHGLMIRQLVRQTAHRVEFAPIPSGEEETVMAQDILWLSRIVWAQQ